MAQNNVYVQFEVDGIVTASNPCWFYFCDNMLYLWDPLASARQQSTHLTCASVQVYGTEESPELPLSRMRACMHACSRHGVHSGALGHSFVSLTCIPSHLASRDCQFSLHFISENGREQVDAVSLL